MNLGTVFLLLAVLLAVGLYLMQPLIERRARRLTGGDREQSTLLAERERLINALQELDFDHSLDKIPAEDYPAQRALLLGKAAEVMRRIDDLQDRAGGRDADRRVEAALAARRSSKPGKRPGARPSDDELESLIAARRKARKGRSGGFCPHCGKPVLASDRFCPTCGKPTK